MEHEHGEATAQVADEGMRTRVDVGGCCLFEPTHGVQALLEMSMVALYSIVEIIRRPMLDAG